MPQFEARVCLSLRGKSTIGVEKSRPTNLNSLDKWMIGHQAGPMEVWQGVRHEQEIIRASHTALVQFQVQGQGGIGCVARGQDHGAVVRAVRAAPSQINDWKKPLLTRAAELFDSGRADESVNLASLHIKIGQQALELDFLNSALTKVGFLNAGK